MTLLMFTGYNLWSNGSQYVYCDKQLNSTCEWEDILLIVSVDVVIVMLM